GDTAVLMATLGKACGTFGAFVAGGEALVETLIQEARTYIYTTAPPPALAWATRTALRLLAAADERRAALAALVERFRAGAAQLGLPLMESSTPIQPLLTGSAARALACSEALRARGLLVTAIRPPTVPEGSARLRITFSAQHEADHVDRLLDALGDVLGQSDEPAGR
ncbi:MAG TPA: aminotransferase class I/II-fold pyridoxal phosphate-dependent enzyme, partial [Gammaproteobacteria bacterium]|nr:aminotransferase class I/II-fold pyridoxal phosphate-dependent enzyme [Gammaproteobacteria bacterium]